MPDPVHETELRDLREAFADLLRHHTRAAHALHGEGSSKPDYPEDECWATGKHAMEALRRFDALLAPDPVHEETATRERVARRIAARDEGQLLASGIGPVSWDALCDADRDNYLALADIALQEAAAPGPEPRSVNDIAYDIVQHNPELEPLVEEFWEWCSAREARRGKAVAEALGRIEATLDADRQLAELPALRSFLAGEIANIRGALDLPYPGESVAPLPSMIVGLVPECDPDAQQEDENDA